MAESGIFPFSIPRASSRQPESVKKHEVLHNSLLQHSAFFIYIKIDIIFGANPRVIEVLNTKASVC